ncbi:MAG: hypothetical protein J2P37_36655, partial [Ktedonobacteraceae bacterium]|nr:hypothetical protein [Ktedonobacteraceae bacterium]
LLQARFSFIERLLREINDGTLTVMTDGQLRWKVLHPELALLQAEEETEQQKTDKPSSRDE